MLPFFLQRTHSCRAHYEWMLCIKYDGYGVFQFYILSSYFLSRFFFICFIFKQEHRVLYLYELISFGDDRYTLLNWCSHQIDSVL